MGLQCKEGQQMIDLLPTPVCTTFTAAFPYSSAAYLSSFLVQH